MRCVSDAGLAAAVGAAAREQFDQTLELLVGALLGSGEALNTVLEGIKHFV